MAATAIDAMELEALDNKTLRAKCNEYGLPNIPITDTSRKLLIKRLIKAIESGVNPTTASTEVEEKPKSRRETIHVIKVNVEKESNKAKQITSQAKSASTRRTIDATSTTTKNYEKENPSEISATQKRRSGRITPISQQPEVPAPTVFKRKIDVMIEEDDDDDDDDYYEEENPIPIPVIVERPLQENPRQNRAPSLSKSVTVTTSYVRDTPPKEIIEILDDPEEEEEEEEAEYEEEEILQPEPVIEPTKYKYISTARSYDTSKPFVPSTDRLSYPTFSYTRGISTSQSPSRVSLSQVPPVSYESIATRRYTSGGYKDLTEGENRTFVHHRADEDDNMKADIKEDAPYLSEFARRLSHLRAEPLANTAVLTNINQNEEKLYRQAPPYYSPSRISSRRGISQNESVADSFYKFVAALDQKYNLKRNLIIFTVILAIILTYVLFF